MNPSLEPFRTKAVEEIAAKLGKQGNVNKADAGHRAEMVFTAALVAARQHHKDHPIIQKHPAITGGVGFMHAAAVSNAENLNAGRLECQINALAALFIMREVRNDTAQGIAKILVKE